MRRTRKTIRIGADLDRNLTALADAEGVTLNTLVESALEMLIRTASDPASVPPLSEDRHRAVIETARRIDSERRDRIRI